MPEAEVGVFGGSGFYSFLEDVEEVELETPYGKPSAPIVIGEVGGKRVAFLPRHGRGHELPPHRIPYRANVLADAGARRAPDHRPERLGCRESGARARRVRRLRPWQGCTRTR
jgi:purine nucleoside phosphorylase